MREKKVGAFSIEDCGIDSSQYFQGVGTAFTEWMEVELGVGENFNTALDDAVDMAIMNGWEFTPEQFAEINAAHGPSDGAHDDCPHHVNGDEFDECELNYYVAIYLR